MYTREETLLVIQVLRTFHDALEGWLTRCREQIHKDMWEVAPGIWIGKQFKDFNECMVYLNSLLEDA